MKREFTFTINPAMKERLEKSLGVGDYSIRFTKERERKVYGTHNAGTRLIVICLGHADFQGSRLTDIHTSIIETLLHEYRHAWQHVHWPEHKWARDDKREYQDKDCETDAREWAARNTTQWRSLGRLGVKSRSSLGRLAKAERSLA